MNVTTPDTWLSRIEAATYLRISATSLAKMAVAGDGPPFYRPSRRVLYRRNDLDQWVATRRCRSTSDVAAVA